jgi:hypothetical protein
MGDWFSNIFGGGGGGGGGAPAAPAAPPPPPVYTAVPPAPTFNPYYGLSPEQGGLGASALLGGGAGIPGGTASFVPTAGLGAQNFSYIPGAYNLLRMGRSPIYSYF